MTRKLILARLLAFLAAAAVCLSASSAFADEAAAAEFYQQATEAYQRGDLRAAADLLDKAFGQNPDLVYKYNRILALQGLGEYEIALSELNTMYQPMKNDPDNRFDDIDEIKAQLEQAVERQKDSGDTGDGDGDTDDGDTGDGDTGDIGDGGELAEPLDSGPPVAAYALLGFGGASLITGTLFATGVLVPRVANDCFFPGNDFDEDEVAQIREDISKKCLLYAKKLEVVETAEAARAAEAREEAEAVVNTHRRVAVTLLSVGAISTAVGVVLLLSSGDSGEAPPTSGLDSIRVAPMVSSKVVGATLQMRF